jgi:NADH-quinone oxidoreductase subunit H
MAEPPVTTLGPGWAVAAAAVVGLLALAAAALDGALTARAEGRTSGGAMTPVLEVARLLRQRRRTTVQADRLLAAVGTWGLVVAAMLMVTVVPLGQWTIFDLGVGVVWFTAVDVCVWALVWLAGWGPNSAYSLVGGYRFLAHGLAYELPLMFALVAPPIAAGSLNVGAVAAAQDNLWFAVWMPVAFLIYGVGVLAFSVWGPFSPALGRDLAGGVAADLSGLDRLLFTAGRYLLLTTGAAFAVPMFLGGGAGPLLPAWSWTLLKTAVLLSVFVFVRRRLPALRPDLFMELAWLVILPAVVVQDFVVAVVAVLVRGSA